MRDSFARASRVGEWPLLMQFPFAEAVICFGFFFVYLLEELGERFMVHEHDDKDEIKKPKSVIANEVDPKSQALLTKENGEASHTHHHHSSSDEEGHHQHGHSHGPVISDQNSVTAAIRGCSN